MSAYFSPTYPDYCLQQFSPLANQSDYSTITPAECVNPQIPTPPTPATFTLTDLYFHQAALLDFNHCVGPYPHSSGSDYTESPPNTGYLATTTLVQDQSPQSPCRRVRGVRPDPSPMFFLSESDPIPNIRRASLPPSILATMASVTALPSPLTQDPCRRLGDAYTPSFVARPPDDGYQSSSCTPTPSPTPSPTSATFPSSSSKSGVNLEASPESGYRSSSSQLKHTDIRRRRADRRRSKLLEIAAVLPFRATDPDEMSSHDKRRCYVGTLEEYVIWLEKEMKVFGGDPITMKKVAKHKGMTCRSLRTMLAHFQDEAHKLHERVQAQEKEALELQALLDEEEHQDRGVGLEPMISNPPSCTPISSPFTTVPIQSQPHTRPQISPSLLQGYEY